MSRPEGADEPWASAARGAVLMALMTSRDYAAEAGKIRAVVMPAVYEAVTEALAAQPAHGDNEAALLRALSRRCHNGADDPWQSFYDDGLALVLERMANHLDYHAERRAALSASAEPETCNCESMSGRFGAHRPECPAAPASAEPEGGEGRG